MPYTKLQNTVLPMKTEYGEKIYEHERKHIVINKLKNTKENIIKERHFCLMQFAENIKMELNNELELVNIKTENTDVSIQYTE